MMAKLQNIKYLTKYQEIWSQFGLVCELFVKRPDPFAQRQNQENQCIIYILVQDIMQQNDLKAYKNMVCKTNISFSSSMNPNQVHNSVEATSF